MATTTALRKLRIVALPLTRPKPRPTPSPIRALSSPRGPKHRLTYYQFQITHPRLAAPLVRDKSSEESSEDTNSTPTKSSWLPEEGLANWASRKAAGIWSGFGQAKGGWKLKVYQAGERLVDRMDFEELALKSFDPSFGPSLAPPKGSSVFSESEKPPLIPLIFPPSILSPTEALADLKAYATHRIPKHRRGFYMWMIIAPFTAPFMIVPVIPNLPFFFCVWRSWSHYKAYKSSQYLHDLIAHDLVVPEESKPLDEIYETHAYRQPSSHQSSSPESESQPEHEQQQLLAKEAIPALVTRLELGGTAEADIRRAVEQARVRVGGVEAGS